jgi:Uma2 family endonuclease
MVAEPKRWFITPEEYLAGEEQAETKSEFIGGEIIAMAGASLTHVRLTISAIRSLANQLEGKPCEVFSQDLRVQMNDEGDYCYPDVGVACEPKIENGNLLNPVVIIEVLSSSTELKDRTIKFEALRRNASLMDYILVSQTRVLIDHYHRLPDNSWNLKSLEQREDELILDSIGCRLTVSDIYARVELPALQAVPQNQSANQSSEEMKND